MSDSDENSKNSKRRRARNLEADYEEAEKLAPFKEEKNVKEVTKKRTHRGLKFNLEPPKKKAVQKKEEDDALPLTCPICKEPFLDPVVTRCNHYFCRNCALKHHEKDNKCFVCKQPTVGVFNTSEEIQQKINQVHQKAKAMLKELSERMEKALGIVTDAEATKAVSAEMVKEAELLVQIVTTYGPSSVADPEWDAVVSMVSKVEDTAAKAKDMAEKAAAMMQEANAAVEISRGEMAKALAMMKTVKWNV